METSSYSSMDDLPAADADASKPLVLIAVDASDQAESAFNYYVANLHTERNDVLLVHIAEPPVLPLGQSADKKSWDEMIAAEQKRIQALEDAYGTMMANNSLKGRIIAIFSNKPGETLCKVASRENCSMIVMGTRGLGVIRRTLLGSVSSYVVHHAHCPVCVCRPTV